VHLLDEIVVGEAREVEILGRVRGHWGDASKQRLFHIAE
jgi:hypothetical protein